MKTVARSLLVLLLLVCLLGKGAESADASEAINPKQKGSLSIVLQDKKQKINLSGVEITIYQVAELVQKENTFSFMLTNGFGTSEISAGDLEDSALAETFRQKITPEMKKEGKATGKDGCVQFTDLTAGVYLILQTKTAEGYCEISPFLATIPMQDQGEWTYDVKAEPKVEKTTPGSEITPTPSVPAPGRTPSGMKKTGTSSRLPYTGQLNWPVPVLAVLGMILFAAGWCLKKGREQNET